MFAMLQVATVLRLVPGPWTKALDALGHWAPPIVSADNGYNLGFLR